MGNSAHLNSRSTRRGVYGPGRREEAATCAKNDSRGRSVSRRSLVDYADDLDGDEVDDADDLDGDDGGGQQTDEPAEVGDEPAEEADVIWPETPTDTYVDTFDYFRQNTEKEAEEPEEEEQEEQKEGQQTKEPNRTMRDNFVANCNPHKLRPPLSKAEVTGIKLLSVLHKQKSPLNAYPATMDWHYRETGLLREEQMLKDIGQHYVSRDNLLKTLIARYGLGGKQPSKRTIRLPHSKEVVKIPCHRVIDVIEQLLTNPLLKRRIFSSTIQKIPLQPHQRILTMSLIAVQVKHT